jgi:hypothetical protein
MPKFQLHSKLHRQPIDTLAIHCGDYRFQQAFHEFLTATLKLGEAYDLMVLPGGPLSLTHQLSHSEDTHSARKWTRFFIDNHNIKRVILIQHQDCGWYKSMSSKLHDPANLRQRQEQDLTRAAEVLKETFPNLNLRVELYVASWDADDHITIDSIPS